MIENVSAFGISTKTFDEYRHTYMPLMRSFENFLNKHLNIHDYGKSLDHIIVIYVAYGMSELWHPEQISYSKKKQYLAIQYRLQADKMHEQSELENLQILALAYLDGMEKAEKKKRIKDFDFKRFRADVAKVFEAEGWLLKEMA